MRLGWWRGWASISLRHFLTTGHLLLVTNGGVFFQLRKRFSRNCLWSFSQQFLLRQTRLILIMCMPWFFLSWWSILWVLLGQVFLENGLVRTTRHNVYHFYRFLRSAARDFSQGINEYEFWKTIPNGEFHSGVSQESQIRSLIHHFIHRLVILSINHKKTWW